MSITTQAYHQGGERSRFSGDPLGDPLGETILASLPPSLRDRIRGLWEAAGGREAFRAQAELSHADREVEMQRQYRASLIEQAIIDSGIPALYRGANFETDHTGDPLVVTSGNRRAIKTARKLAEEFDRDWTRGLMFYSPAFGCGKTYLMCAVGLAVIRRSAIFRIATAARILDEIRDTFGRVTFENGGRSTEQVYARYAEEPHLLVIDELGGQSIKSDDRGAWAREQMLKIVDHRVTSGKCTCVTTNLPEEDLAEMYGGRFMSRIMGATTLVKIEAPDFRRRATASDPFAEVK